MKRTSIFIIMITAVMLMGQTIRERIDDYNALKAANNAAYVQVIEGVGAQMLGTANAQVQEAISIRVAAQTAIDADPNIDWETSEYLQLLVDNYMGYEDTIIKVQMLSAFEDIIGFVRAEMNDEYSDKGLAARKQAVAVMQMLVLIIEGSLNGFPDEVE